MLNLSRLRSAAVLVTGLASLLAFQAAPAAAQTLEGPGPEELAMLGGAAVATTSGLPQEALDAAGAYRKYTRQVATLSANFSDGPSIARALKLGAAYEPKQLARGAIGFAALTALQEPEFVAGVRAVGADPARRAALTAELVRNPAAVLRLAGAEGAAIRIAVALNGEGERVHALGLRVKQAAYDVQRQGWSKAEVSARVERLAEVKALSALPFTASQAELVDLQRVSLTGAASLAPVSFEAAQRPVVQRGLALAALAVLGEAQSATVQPLLNDAECGSCLRMSKLNLFQCLAVAKPWYEDVFCLGQHVLMDTGDCIQAAAVSRRVVPKSLPAVIAAVPSPLPSTTVAALR